MIPNFRKEHHRAIAFALSCLDGELLRKNSCFFGGGTAIALLHGEYRTSVDIDFLVSKHEHYVNLRNLVKEKGINALARIPLEQVTEPRSDQYGIRTQISVHGSSIKFEIVSEGRIQLGEPAAETLCGVPVLSATDQIATKLLANSDRWNDSGIFSRDIIDLAMLAPSRESFQLGLAKAQVGYGEAIIQDLSKAIEHALKKDGWLDRCISTMDMDVPKALLWKNIRRLEKMLRSGASQ